jgi:hypothetical protein
MKHFASPENDVVSYDDMPLNTVKSCFDTKAFYR